MDKELFKTHIIQSHDWIKDDENSFQRSIKVNNMSLVSSNVQIVYNQRNGRIVFKDSATQTPLAE